MRHRLLPIVSVAVGVSLLLVSPATAHHLPPGMEDIDEFADNASFLMGMNHPLSGWDHLLAALLTGALASRLSKAGRLILPAAAVLAMLGGMLAPPLPVGESMLAASVLAAAGMQWCRSARALRAGAVTLAVFQIWHGNAHAMEAPVNAARILFLTGTAAATLVCIGLGMALAILAQRWMTRPEDAVQTA